MDIPPVISTQPASKVRPVLVRIALAAALFLATILLLDCVIHHQIIPLFIQSEWYVLLGSGMLLVFFLALLLGKLRDMVLPVSRAWDDSDHVNFIVLFCIFGFFLLPAFYFVAMISMIHDYGSPGE
jgi:Na+-driven multidrug efflux pump